MTRKAQYGTLLKPALNRIPGNSWAKIIRIVITNTYEGIIKVLMDWLKFNYNKVIGELSLNELVEP
jgi:hypothetical protein